MPLIGSVDIQDACRDELDEAYTPSSVTTGVEGGLVSTVIPSLNPAELQRSPLFLALTAKK